ncbi:PEP-CTERM sorting domain-containing protein [Paucibacter sp. B2R-40]|uniref:PEP-CTERM sorting domain-containing protein n=1 Tax=Paucibacter sp. B2R-40 TaxID=2893554 RepID=UPI0021E4997A|nr:PEP-CTERM sorting domain-containing protein [Paucibacter sp. B2R-40]MCV2354330.1 PEP-CTERM sorting domain-containing protein [Paucibacter sp. B2R-40]
MQDQSRFKFALSALGLAATLLAPAAQAGVVYSEGFDAGFSSTNWSRGDAYWQNCGGQSNCIFGSGGQSGAYFNLGTNTGPTGPNSQPDHRFFISSVFNVAANSLYTLNFYVADDYAGFAPYNVPIQAQVNGSNVGGIVKASVGGWNLLSMDWNSGSATTAQITLKNEYQLSGYYQGGGSHDWGYGNDFRVDSISMSGNAPVSNPVPEPASLALVALALLGLRVSRRA